MQSASALPACRCLAVTAALSVACERQDDSFESLVAKVASSCRALTSELLAGTGGPTPARDTDVDQPMVDDPLREDDRALEARFRELERRVRVDTCET